MRHTGLALLVGVAVGAPLLAAEEPVAAPQRPLLGSSAARYETGAAGSLAEVARHLRLARPATDPAVEVNDLNLREIAAQGTISVTEGVVLPPEPARAPGPPPGESALEEWEKRYAEQSEALKAAQERLAAVDTFTVESRDPYQQGPGPHSRAPGVISPELQQREEAARALAEERARLDALRREGRRLGAGR